MNQTCIRSSRGWSWDRTFEGREEHVWNLGWTKVEAMQGGRGPTYAIQNANAWLAEAR